MNRKEYAWFVGMMVAISFMAGLMFKAEISQVFGATILTTNSTDTIGTFRTNVNTSLTNLNTQLLATVATTTSLGDLAFINSPLGVASGGTGATSASNARTNLGLGAGDSPTFTGVTATSATTTNLFATNFLFTSATGTNLTITNLKDASGTKYSTSSAADPTASVGLSAVNGSASSFMRSDAAPAIDQSIAPTWTGFHQFSGAGVSSTALRTPSATIQTLWDTHGNKYVTSSAASFLTTGSAPSVSSSATSTATVESQQSILYSGPTGRATTSQPLGTGYTFTAQAIQVVPTNGASDASTTVTLDECSSSAYSDCSTKATTASFNHTGDGSTYVNASFTTPYAMKPDRYYRYFATYGNGTGRIQCGNTASSTPITVGDNDQCGGAGRAATFKLNGFTTQPATSGNNNSFDLIWGAATTTRINWNAIPSFTKPRCGMTTNQIRNSFSVTYNGTTSIDVSASSSANGYTTYFVCLDATS